MGCVVINCMYKSHVTAKGFSTWNFIRADIAKY